MRQTIIFPALVEAVPPRGRNLKLAFCGLETTVDMAEISSADAPVAFSHRTRQKFPGMTEYRLHEGRLYRDLTVDAEKFFDNLGRTSLDSRGAVFGDLVRKMGDSDEAVQANYRSLLWPEGAKHMMTNGMNTEWKLYQEVLEQSGKLKFAEGTDAAIDGFRKRALERMGDFVSLEGRVWRACREPCYSVDMERHAEPVPAPGRSDFYARSADPTVAGDDADIWKRTRYTFYGADRLEEILSTVPGARPPASPIEVHIPAALRIDFEAMEIDRCARLMCEGIADRMARNAHRRQNETDPLAHVRSAMPDGPLLEAWADARDFTGSYDPFDGVPEAVEDHVQSMYDAAAPGSRDGYFLYATGHTEIETRLSRWRNREVVPTFANAAGYGA